MPRPACPRPWYRRARRATAWALLIVVLGSPAAAQTLSIGVGGARSALTARLAVEGVERGAGTVGLAAVLSPAPGVDLSVRGARAFGPLGTLTLEARAGARALPELRGRLSLGARGAFGPVAGSLRARAWAAPPERFDPFEDPGPARTDAGAELRLEAEGRLSRTWLLGGTARGEWDLADAATLDLELRGRARRLPTPETDLELRLGGRAAGDGDGRAFLGAGVRYVPRRAPEILALAVLDVAPAAGGGVRAAPGVATEGALRGVGGRVEWALRLRPLAGSRAPWWARVGWNRPLDAGTLSVEATLAHGGAAGTAAALAVGWERPVDLR